MANKHINEEMFEQIINLCEEIVKTCNSCGSRDKSFEENVDKQHYMIRFPKCLPYKVLINGKLKDLQNLSHAEREAVRTQREIDKARERSRQERMARIERLRMNRQL